MFTNQVSPSQIVFIGQRATRMYELHFDLDDFEVDETVPVRLPEVIRAQKIKEKRYQW